MKIVVDVELMESEMQNAPQIMQLFQGISDRVSAKVYTDKAALSRFISECIASGKPDVAMNEILRRLNQPALAEDCMDVVCSLVLSEQRIEKNESVLPYMTIISRLHEPFRGRLRDDLLGRILPQLSKSRPRDSARQALLPFAECLAGLVKVECVNARSAVSAMIQLLRIEGTRCAAITCLGKLVEIAFNSVADRCDGSLLEELRSTLGDAQDDAFLYDIEYITEPFGWNQSTRFVNCSLLRSMSHHELPILALAYGGVQREIVVTSSGDGTIATWDNQGQLVENVVLARHYASALELANRGRTLLVGGVGREGDVQAAVVIYLEENGRWVEKGAVEPQARVITCLRSIQQSSSVTFCCGIHNGEHSYITYYDASRPTQALREYHDHSDIVTTLYTPSDRDFVMISGSRDTSILLYDLRAPNPTVLANHYGTVTGLGMCGDYVISAGLDKRMLVHDIRSTHQGVLMRDLESPVLSLSVSQQGICALSTMTGVHLSALMSQGMMCRVEGHVSSPRYNAVSWNSTGSILYAGGDNNTLDIFQTS